MRTYQQTVRVGENVGPVNWEHPMAINKPQIWRDAEKNPGDYLFSEYRRTIIEICMYDGWPYWEPTPAICFIGPLHSAEWSFFNSYGVSDNSIELRPASVSP